jgi:hypothetical protein
MNTHLLATPALVVVAVMAFASSSTAQQRRPQPQTYTPQSIQQHYGVQGTYDGTMLHPEGRRSTAVPVNMDDGRTGEFVIPSDRKDPHPAYYRDDQTGDLHPVKIDPHVTRRQFVQNPRALRYQAEPKHANKQAWEKDALIVGGAAGGGALIGAAAGGGKGAAVGAAAGGVAGLIYDLVKNKR